MPEVSIVIPTYNAAAYLPETLQYILDQDFQDYEIIIVDDSSTDNTQEINKRLDSEKITYHILEKNHGGPSLPRNQGIKKAKGEFIALCDSDDLFTKKRLLEHVRFLETYKDIAMVFSNALKFDNSTGNNLGLFLDGYDRFYNLPKQQLEKDFFRIAPDKAYSCLFYENYIMPSGVTVRKDIFDTIGYFDETLTNGDDRDMWFRLTRKYAIGFWNQVGFKYRIVDGSISTRGPSLAENRIKVLEKQLRTNLPQQLQRQCKRQIAKNYYGIGYAYQKKLDMVEAKRYYLRSFGISPSKHATKGLFISFLPKKLYTLLRQSKE